MAIVTMCRIERIHYTDVICHIGVTVPAIVGVTVLITIKHDYSPSCNRLRASVSISLVLLPNAQPLACTETSLSVYSISLFALFQMLSQVGRLIVLPLSV